MQCSAPGAAVALKLMLMDSRLFMTLPDMDNFNKLSHNRSAEDSSLETMTADILEGEAEKAFWAKVPVTARQTDQPGNPYLDRGSNRNGGRRDSRPDRRKRKEDREGDQGANKHIRF